ncbi:MAG: outer membrane beta-barrel protein [Deltaproteobacteria bacterium]|nr:outer membrane beta-barrel protein [Deltaproteobacteria bacterium]
MLNPQKLLSRLCVAVSILCLGIILIPRPTLADVKVKPRIILEEEYNDNWYRAERNKTTFWVTSVSPGINVEAFTERSFLSLDYGFGYYWHNSQRSSVNGSGQNYLGHNLGLSAAHRPTSRLTLGLTEEFFLTREPASSDQFSDIVSRKKYWRNRVSPSIKYDLAEKGAITLGYRNERLKWKNPDPGQGDSWENRGIVTLTYNLNSTNHLDLEQQYWRRSYDAGLSDYDAYQAKLVFRHEFNTYLSGEAGAGYQRRTFDESGLSNQDSFVFHTTLTGATDRSKLDVSFERNFVDFTTEDQYFEAYRFDLYAEHIFLEKIRAYLGGYYQNSDYIGSPRKDDTYNGFGGLGYRFLRDIFELSVEYNYTERGSNERGRRYKENRVFFRLTTVYDITEFFTRQ